VRKKFFCKFKFFYECSNFPRIFFFTQPLKINSLSVLTLESWYFYAILTTYQRWFPENFVKICLILTSKISFEKFGKNIDFRKSPKKFGQNGWREISFFYIFWTLGSQGKEGRWDIPRNMEKSENHCTLLYMPVARGDCLPTIIPRRSKT
jgi:hypothetical protein